jgi:LysR family transcriptional regulator, hypochlorite-specific transcription factor HypT
VHVAQKAFKRRSYTAAVETKWLEDFVSLAETRSFSRSAQLRHVTQPAFSRRIQALEAWAGVDLVDRSSYPTRLTAAGETLLGQAVEMLGSLQATRNMLRSHQAVGQDMIEFAVPHSLAFSFFPHWLMGLRQGFGALKSRLNAHNVHDAMMQLNEGNCDLLIVYHHPSQPLQLDPERYEMASLGHETLAAYAKADPQGRPMFALPGHAGQKIPFLSYAAGAYLGRLVELVVKSSPTALNLDSIYETDMAEGLKAMALEGHGLAFLPASSVKKELKSRRLVQAAPPGDYELSMELRIYRERPDVARRSKPAALALWNFLTEGGKS